MTKQRVALVLSSGGARGLAHIGVIEELEQRGYEITSIAGSSIGSVIGGAYAAKGLEIYKEWVLSLTKREVFRLMDFTLSSYGLMKGEKVFNEMKSRIAAVNIEDLAIPFKALATNLETKKEVVFEKGNLYEAMRASVSIPTVFTPYNLNNQHLVDGGLLNPVPIKQITRTENDLLMVVNLYADASSHCSLLSHQELQEEKESSNYINLYHKFKNYLPKIQKEKLSYTNIINSTIDIMLKRITELEMQLNKPDIVVNISRNISSTFEFYKAKKLIETGRKAAKFTLDEFEKKGGLK